MVNNSKDFLLEPLHSKMPIVDADGNPTPYFQHIMQLVQLGVTLTKGPGGELNIAEGEITLEMLQEIQAKHVLGLGGTVNGPVEEITASQLLDWLGTAAQGDIIYRNASGWVFLHAGTAGQVLTTQGPSANPSWTTPTSGGGEVLLDSQTVSGVTQVLFVSKITSTYKHYRLEYWDILPSVDNALRLRVSINNGSSYDATAIYDTSLHQVNTGTFQAAVNAGASQNAMILANSFESTSGIGFGEVRLLDPLGTSSQKGFLMHAGGLVTDAFFYGFYGAGRWRNTAAYNAFQVIVGSGTVAGKFRLYGTP